MILPQHDHFRAALNAAEAIAHGPESPAGLVPETGPGAALAAVKAAFDAGIATGLNRDDLLALLASDKTPQHYEALILILAALGQDSPYKQVVRLRRLINKADHYESGPQIKVPLLRWEWLALELFLVLWCVNERECGVAVREAHAILRRLPDRTPPALSRGQKNPALLCETLTVSAEAWVRLAAYAPCFLAGPLFHRREALEFQIFRTDAAKEQARAMQDAAISAIRGSALFFALQICKYHDFRLPPTY